jgi:hypothetical protein
MALWAVLTQVEQNGQGFWLTVQALFRRALVALRDTVHRDRWSPLIAIRYDEFAAQREWNLNMIKKKAANAENGLGRVVRRVPGPGEGPAEGPAIMVSMDDLLASLRGTARLDDLLVVQDIVRGLL